MAGLLPLKWYLTTTSVWSPCCNMIGSSSLLLGATLNPVVALMFQNEHFPLITSFFPERRRFRGENYLFVRFDYFRWSFLRIYRIAIRYITISFLRVERWGNTSTQFVDVGSGGSSSPLFMICQVPKSIDSWSTQLWADHSSNSTQPGFWVYPGILFHGGFRRWLRSSGFLINSEIAGYLLTCGRYKLVNSFYVATSLHT